MRIPCLSIDSTRAITELCIIGKSTAADKSPINHRGHRHPYTPIYNMILSPLISIPIRFAEFGVAGGASALMWDSFFPHKECELHFFDRDDGFLSHTKRLTSDRARFSLMDVSIDGDVGRALRESSNGKLYDVILDDSSHIFEHQIRIIRESIDYLRPGGMIIIEDIYRTESEERYEEALKDILSLFSFSYFVICEHANRWSPGWENDKLLILVKK